MSFERCLHKFASPFAPRSEHLPSVRPLPVVRPKFGAMDEPPQVHLFGHLADRLAVAQLSNLLIQPAGRLPKTRGALTDDVERADHDRSQRGGAQAHHLLLADGVALGAAEAVRADADVAAALLHVHADAAVHARVREALVLVGAVLLVRRQHEAGRASAQAKVVRGGRSRSKVGSKSGT